MATTTPPTLRTALRSETNTEVRRRGHRRAWRGWLATLVVVVVLVTAALGAWRLAGIWLAAPVNKHILTHRVASGDLLVTITEDGNLESASNIDVKCQVAGGSTILSIVPDGTLVHKGDELARLDSSAIEEQVNQQKIICEKALAMKIQAEKEFAAARIAVQEYLEGTYVKELQAIEAQITIAMENLRSSENTLQHTERMARRGYVTPLQLDAQRFAVERARLDLRTAELAKDVLERFTKRKMLEDLESARDTAEARMRSEQTAYELEEARLERLKAQLANCVIYAPQDGMVVYANERSSRFGGSSGAMIEEGAGVRDRQSIVRLPDLSQMQVKVTVHESKVESLELGMRAQVNIQGRRFTGVVTSVANQPEPTSFFSANVKEYAAVVRIDGDQTDLRPGMTAQVEILVASLKNVLSVPVQAVVEQGGKFFCWVMADDQPQQRPVVLGLSNSKVIEIKDGLVEGELVVLNPLATIPEARKQVPHDDEHDVSKRFGAPGVPSEAPPSIPPAGPLAADEAAPPQRQPSDGPPRSGGQRSPRQNNPLQFDKDGDGKLSRDEAPQSMQSAFDRLDANGDGLLDASELAAPRSRSAEAPPAAPPQAGGG